MNSYSDIIPFNSFTYSFLLIFSIITYRKYQGNKTFENRRDKLFSYIFGFIFVFMYASGLFLSNNGEYNLSSTIQIVMASALLAPSIGIAYNWLNRYLYNFFNKYSKSDCYISQHPIIASSIVMLICWLPIFLALYPGLFAYDVNMQLTQYIDNKYSTHHPLLHTFYLQFFYQLGEKTGFYNTYLALSVLIQMFLTSLSLSYSIKYLVDKKVNIKIIQFLLLFFALVPIFPILIVSMTKDVFFMASFNVGFIKLLKLQDNNFKFRDKSEFASLLLFFILTSLLRNNGKYVIFFTTIALLIMSIYKRENIKNMSILCISSIFFVMLCNSLLISAFDASPGSKNEAMSIPYQQMARVYKLENDTLNKKDIETIELLIPYIDNYNPYSADGIKYGKIFGGFEYTSKFPAIYLKCLVYHPIRCFEAILLNTQGYWYLNDVTSSQMYGKSSNGIPRDDYGLFLMDTKEGYGVTHESKFIFLDKVLKDLFHLNYYQKMPVFASIFSMASYFWLFVCLLFRSIQAGNKKAIIPFIYVITLLATIFAGPCALFRYMLPIIVSIPSLMVVVYKN